MMYDGWMGGMWPFGGLLWIAVLALVVYGIVQFIRMRPAGPAGESSASSPALSVLDERYAKSEIDRDEYLRRKRDILGKGQP
jgi:putative membrane protein